MPESMAMVLVGILGVYLGLGLLVALAIQLLGLGRLDPATAGSTWGFRAIVLPGLVALWPLVLRRWIAGTGAPVERNAHRRAAGDPR